MKFFFAAIASFSVLLGTVEAAGSTQAGEVKTISVIEQLEPYDTLIFHGDLLWSGHSRVNSNQPFEVRAFDRNDKLVATVSLPHAISDLAPYGANSVIATGTSPSTSSNDPAKTMFTVLRFENGKVTHKTTAVPISAWATTWIGTVSGKEFFTDPGGNVNDTEIDDDLSLASQTLFSFDGRNPAYLKTRMRYPFSGKPWKEQLLVLQRQSLGSTATNMQLVNTNSGKFISIFPSFRNNLRAFEIFKNTELVALLEAGTNEIHVLDVEKTQITATAETFDGARTLKTIGSCAVVGSYESRVVEVFHTSNDHRALEKILTLKVDLPQNEFMRLSALAIDTQTGKIYARSNFACNPFMQICDEDWNRIVSFEGTYKDKLKQTCM